MPRPNTPTTRNTAATPLTHWKDGEDRRRLYCKCNTCEKVGICTPTTDYYARNDGDPLQCERCFFHQIGAPGLNGLRSGVEKMIKS